MKVHFNVKNIHFDKVQGPFRSFVKFLGDNGSDESHEKVPFRFHVECALFLPDQIEDAFAVKSTRITSRTCYACLLSCFLFLLSHSLLNQDNQLVLPTPSRCDPSWKRAHLFQIYL